MTAAQTIVIASGNQGKLREFHAILSKYNWQVRPQSDFNVSEAAEVGLTFVENAILKARNAAQQTGLPAVADDSGIEVDALHGRPGIYSARYAGEPANDGLNNQQLLHELAGVPAAARTARYQCVIAYLRHAEDPTPMLCQGTWQGEILTEPTGENGFGYDPLFWVPEHQCSAAELEPGLKNAISHRGQALTRLAEVLALNTTAE